jgi:hypothetical protein
MLAIQSLDSLSPECLVRLPFIPKTTVVSHSCSSEIAKSFFERFPQRAHRFPKLVEDIVFRNQVANLLREDDEVCVVTPRIHALLALMESINKFHSINESVNEEHELIEHCDSLFIELENPEGDPLVF